MSSLKYHVFALPLGSAHTSNIPIVFLSLLLSKCWSNKKWVCVAAVQLGRFSV